MTDQKNTIIAIVLSALILIAWQIYFGLPQMEKQKQIQQQQAQDISSVQKDVSDLSDRVDQVEQAQENAAGGGP